ncbi:MAG: hypothetical protein IJC12_01125, partial [Peptococcaceae bacterium]|nr:hypothetical protein [Peptococcaceae bacterium]
MTYEMELALQNTFLDFVNLTITAAWVIVAVLVLRAVLTRVPRKYVCLLWLVVLFRLLCPVSIETVLSVVPQPVTITYEDVAYTTPKIETNSAVVNTIADFTVNPVMEEYLAPTPHASVNPMQVYLMMASMLWVLGIVVIALYTIVSWARMGLRLRESVPEGGYYRCANIDSPFVFGLLKPKIYLPYGLDGEAKDYVLLHEQSHIARKDFLLKPIFWIAVAIHWMNPMVWVAWHYFTRDLELACDERAVDSLNANQKSDYSQTLLNLAVQPKRFTCPVAFGNNSVKQRITHVLHYKGIPALARDIVIVLLVLVMILLAVNPLKAGPLSEFEPKLLEEYPYGLNVINISYGVVDVHIDDKNEMEQFRDWLSNVKVQTTKSDGRPWYTGVRISVFGVKNEYYDEETLNRHIEFEGVSLNIARDLSTVYAEGQFESKLKIRDAEAFREMILSYCKNGINNYPDTTFYADLNRDGTDELIIVDTTDPWDSQGQADIAVYKQDGTLLYSTYLNAAHAGWNNYFLYEKDGKDYLMEFMPSMYQGVANYSWKLYEFDEKNQLVIAEENKVDFTINPEQYDFDINAIIAFLSEVETMLNDATLLVSVEDSNLLYSTVSEPKQIGLDYYLKWLDTTWTGEKNIGTSLAERLTNYQYSIYYDRPRQALTMWLTENKGFNASLQHLAGPDLVEIDGKQCVLFDLRWNEVAPVPGGHIDRYAITVSDPDDMMDGVNGRTYYVYNANDNKWIELENSADKVNTYELAGQWGQSYLSKDGQARYDLLSPNWQSQIDKLDEGESIGLEWMPYWLDGKQSLSIGNPGLRADVMHIKCPVIIDGDGVHYTAEILYEIADLEENIYMYEETITFGVIDDIWKVVDCMVTVNLLPKEIYELAVEIQTQVNEGEERWRIDPLEVASKFADDYLQLADGYWMEFDESRNIVLCHTDTQDYTIYLYQPIKDRWDPEFDIYAVSGYEYTETDINGKEQLRSYYVGNEPWAS